MRISDWSSDVCSSDLAPAPSPTPSTNELFTQAEANVPAADPLSAPSEFESVLSPFTGRAFATGIGQSDGGIGPMAIVETPDGAILFSGGANQIGRASGRDRVCQYV